MDIDANLTNEVFIPAIMWWWNMLLIIILAVWEMAWKWIALWKAGKNRQLTRFIFIFIFNTAGILPIVYLILNRKKK